MELILTLAFWFYTCNKLCRIAKLLIDHSINGVNERERVVVWRG